MALTSRQYSAVFCFCLVAQKFKITTDSHKLLREKRVDTDKSPVDILKSLAAQYGLAVRRISLSDRENSRPATPFLFQNTRGVISLATERNEHGYIVVNPGQAEGRTVLSHQELIAASPGHVMEVVETRWTPPDNRTFGVWWLLERLRPYSQLAWKIGVSALVLQLFATALPLFSQVIIDKVLSRSNPSMLYLLGTGIAITIVFELVLAIIRTKQQAFIASKLDIAIGVQIQRHLFQLPLIFFNKRSAGHVTGVFNELDTIRHFITGPGISSVIDLAFFVVFIPLMLMYSPTLTAITAVAAAFILLFAYAIKGLERSYMRASSDYNTRCHSQMLECIANMETLKTLAAENYAARKWEQSFTRLVIATMRNGSLQGTSMAVNGFLQRVCTLAILWFGAELVISGSMSAGQLIAFQMLSFRVMYPLQRLTHLWHEWKRVQHAVERLTDIMDSPPEKIDTDDRITALPPGSISMQSVTFIYPGQHAPTLKNISLHFPDAAAVALIGRSGSGKSTLLKLLLRLYPQSGGLIEYGATDARLINPTLLRRRVSLVLQESHLMTGSVAENIAFKAPWATTEQIIEAATCVGAHEFIKDLPHGYSTLLGEGGINLSGGQRQRIALARAILDEPDVLILDEATSAIDVYGEQRIYANLTGKFRDRKLIVITHRLSSIVNFDLIHILHAGELVGSGTHRELLDTCPIYAQLHASTTAERQLVELASHE
ncbi:peptidase domain-containing ABC transporter [Massilia sp. METH4]|uniref:peptidase domain-containing ABC transporter n=1 Tax=Massilia sp. METH4 TaxID=3123041 RepID=UPI0030CAAE09